MAPRSYATAVQRAGAVALLLPRRSAGRVRSRRLPGPHRRAAAGGRLRTSTRRPTGRCRTRRPSGTWPERDAFELALARRALEREMPVLGICRGMQLLNVACGGTLTQHLPDVVGHARPPPHARHVRRPRGAARAGLAGRARGRRRAGDRQVAPPPGRRAGGRGPGGHRLVGTPTSVVEAIELPGPGLRPRRAVAPRGGRARPRGRRAGRGGRAGCRRDEQPRGARARHRAGDGRGPARGRRGDRRGGRPRQGGLPGLARGRRRATAPPLLRRLADALEAALEELAVLEARNAGKPIGDARGEMGMVVETFRYYAGAPERLLGETIPVAGGVDMTFREPLGVVGADRAVELPAGDRVVEGRAGAGRRQHDRAQARRADAADRARARAASRSRPGCPRASLNVVAGPGSVCGQRLVEHPDVAKVAFTGSTEVGRGIAAGAADTIKRVTLELGGKSANVVFADADLEARRGRGAGRHVRQRRPGLLRALAHPRRALGARPLHGRAGGGGRGDARRRPARRGDRDGAADLRRPALETVASYVPDDAPVAIRGSAPDGPGFWFPPTVLAPVSNDDRAAAEEIFGPVAVRHPVRRRGRGGRGSPTTRSTGCRARSGRATARGRCASRGRSRAGVAVGQLEHLGAGDHAVRRLQAVGRRAASSARTRSSTTPRSRTSTTRRGLADGGPAGRQGLRHHRRGERHRRGDRAAVHARRARAWSGVDLVAGLGRRPRASGRRHRRASRSATCTRACASEFGRIDVLFNNAGISPADDASVLETVARGVAARAGREPAQSCSCAASTASRTCSRAAAGR